MQRNTELHKNSHKMCKHTKITVKVDNTHIFLDCAYKSQDFVQSQENGTQSHNCETVTVRNSAAELSPTPQMLQSPGVFSK